MVFPSFTLRKTETSQEAIKRSDPKKGKKTIDASEDSTVPSMNNVVQVQARKVSEQVLPLDEVRENIEVRLLFEDDNVKGNVLEVREDSEDALPSDKTKASTDNVLEESDVQVDKGSDAFTENKQKGVKVEEELSELNSRMKTTVTKKKVRFKIPPDENEKKAKRTKFFGRKPVSKKTNSVIFIKATDKKQKSTREREILVLHDVSRPTIEKKVDDSEAKEEKEGMSNCSIAVKSEQKGTSNRSMADDGKAPVSLMVEDVYALITEEASQAYALLPDEALQAYDMIAKRAGDTLSFDQLGDSVVKEGQAVSQSQQEGEKAQEQNEARAREAPGEASNNEGQGAEDQEGAQASEEMDKVVKAKKFKDNAIQDEAVRAKEVTEKESVDQEKTQDQKPSSFKFIKATDKKQGSVREVLGLREVSNETSTVKFIKADEKKQRSVRQMLGLREVSRAKNSKKKGATNRPIADDGKAPISLMVENVYASIVKELSQTGALAYALIPDEALQACDMFSEETLRSLFFFKCLREEVDASIVEKASQAYSLIPDEALQAYDMIAKRAPHPLPLDQLGDSVVKEGHAVSQSKQEGEKAQEQNEARAREAPEEASNNEGEGAQDQEGAQSREETVEVIKSKMSRTVSSRTKLFGPKMLRAKKPPSQEMAQNQDVIEKSHARKESQVVNDSQDHENVEEEYFF